MKFFIDSADVEEIRKAHAMGCVDGVTTNPSLLAKVGRGLEETIREICSIVDGPISAECVSMEADELIKEGRSLAKIHDNVVVKIPMGVEGMKATKALTAEGIRTNVTLCFSANQALLCAKAGATYVSPFVGRLDDISQDGMELISHILEIFRNYEYFNTQVLVASVRNPVHVLQAARLGADVATLPYNVITQLANHPLTDAGIKKFLADWEKVPKATKPPAAQ
ncbi:fructose-6-phosphate aldolase [Myxococcus sp. AM009]|uniref:fructose-6-phosphate aldolase n=1 Tax=unclassified Myxococcus TaxID=2648731 RepID=UPI00159551AA|nr:MULTISPECIES: fructose-6-phosphate aldolase [unclassified Myxococcus]NVI99814.1 fructose-6-phosphate aldolase [Myxococcus sp. AM009]NVJ17919.1 fructose-6-phosphate aldolase [Myxococcus sp. AM010]